MANISLLSLIWQTFTTCFITNHDHAHLSGHMKNDAHISITRVWGYHYALVADTHNAQFVNKSNCKKPCNTCRPYLGQHVPGFNSMQLWLKVILGYL